VAISFLMMASRSCSLRTALPPYNSWFTAPKKTQNPQVHGIHIQARANTSAGATGFVAFEEPVDQCEIDESSREEYVFLRGAEHSHKSNVGGKKKLVVLKIHQTTIHPSNTL